MPDMAGRALTGMSAADFGKPSEFSVQEMGMRGEHDGEGGERRARYEALEHGQVVHGVVTDVRNFGVFVDLGGIDGIDGMINSAEISWAHIRHPSEVVKVGDQVTVMVLGVDLDREQASLSLKALHPDPMTEFARTRLGAAMRGQVTREFPPGGVFVAVAEGIEGLIRSADLDRALRVGDQVMVEIAERRCSPARSTHRQRHDVVAAGEPLTYTSPLSAPPR